MRKIIFGYTFDDYLLVPAYSEVLPDTVDLRSHFSKRVMLNVPIASAPMDKVTTHPLAIAIAKEGGIGIIHRKMQLEKEVEEVKKVKRHQAYVILAPWTLRPHNTVVEAKNLMQEKGISGIPIINDVGVLVGIITRRNIQFMRNGDTSMVQDVMTQKEDLITGQMGILPRDALDIMKRNRVEKLPLVDEHYHLAGLITAKDVKKSEEFPNANVDACGRLIVGAAIGVTGDFFERAHALVEARADVLVIDTAHGDSKNVVSALRRLRPAISIDIVAGNIATASAAIRLVREGADGLRVGIGPGSVCTTRIVTGNGVPQMTAIMDVSDAVSDDIPVIADGGIEYSGQIVKGLAGGASCVMLGKIMAGTHEAPGKLIEIGGKQFKDYRGMGSLAVLNEGGERYGAKAVPEGVESIVDYIGTVAKVFEQLTGGIRQGMGYQGCTTVKMLSLSPTFCRITAAGLRESHVHGVHITNEAPNYKAP